MKTTLKFDGLTIDLERTGPAITGHARSPEAFHRDPLPIDFTVRANGD